MSTASKLRPPSLPRPSSSLIILSPLAAPSGCGFDYRIVMVRRNAKSSFKNATVFPGGNVDPCDRNGDTATACAEVDISAFKRCALRETFEETGILITTPRISFSRGERSKWRENVHNTAKTFSKLLNTFDTTLDLDKLVHYANWITPVKLVRRYDTRFFLTVVNASETLPAKHDNSETLKIDHFTPIEAIAAHKRGEIVLFLPQLYMLHDLSLYKTYSALLDAVRSRPVFTTQPIMQPKLGFVALPGDETRGGRPGTKNRVSVTLEDGNFVPSHVLRHNLEGFPDMETAHVADAMSLTVEKTKI